MRSLLLNLSLLLLPTTSFCSASEFVVDGKVMELHESNIDAAISTFHYIFIDFYAPWCAHCMRLNPELDKAAPILAGLKNPVIIAKVNVDKYKSLVEKHNIGGFPTLKMFIHGVPTEYYGPREFDQLVQYLKKFAAPDVAILNSDSEVAEFVKEAGIDFPIFMGFDVKESIMSNLAIKYKKKAWFSVTENLSEELKSFYDFDKVPALVALRPNDREQSIFHGPFEGEGSRKVALTIVEDETSDNTRDLIKLLKPAASANRDLIFGYVGVKQHEEFVEPFEVSRKTQLPKMIIWDRDEEYLSVNGSEWIKEDDQGSQITRFLEGYREGNVTQKRISGPSIMGFFSSLFGLGTVCTIGFTLFMMVLIMIFVKDDEPTTDGPRRSADRTSDVKPQSESGRDKED